MASNTPDLQAQKHLKALLRRVQGPRLRTRFEGKYCFVSTFWLRYPVCRLQFLGELDAWRCAIFRPSHGNYGSDGFFFPADGDPVGLTEMCINALGLD